MPWRSAAPDVATVWPSAASPDSTVGPVQPGLGCAATPTGLSTTTMSASLYTTVSPATSAGSTAAGACAGPGSVISSQDPAVTRSDLDRAVPSISTSPASTTAAAAVRDRPNRRETA